MNLPSTDVASLADTIRDKVRSTIAATIPDEQINGLIKKEYDSFFARPERRYTSDPEPISPFAAMIKAEIDKLLRTKISEEVNKEINRFFSQDVYSTTGKRVLETLVKEYAPSALEGMAEALVQSSIQRISQNRPY